MKTYNNPINDAIDHFLNHSLNEVFGVSLSTKHPAVNIYEDSETHFLELAVPGFTKEDISISIENESLIVKATIAEKTESKSDQSFIHKEFVYDAFERYFTIPQTADVSNIKASYNAGILTISMAKKEEAKDKGPIDIKIS